MPQKTASKFVFVDGARIYKTGDLVREDKDGSVVFIGRADSQVKIRGYRVELEDIETRISESKVANRCCSCSKKPSLKCRSL